MYPGLAKAATTGRTKAAPGFMIGMDSEAKCLQVALGNAEHMIHYTFPVGLYVADRLSVR